MPAPRFRTRLFAILLLFAVAPAVIVTLGWAGAAERALPMVSRGAAWDSVAGTGERAIRALRTAPLTPDQRAALVAHEQELRLSYEQARRFRYLAERTARVVAFLVVGGLALLVLLASRMAGHLSRQLSRPILELVTWTELIARGERLPGGPARRGAPEFEVLRQRMRQAAVALEEGRRRAREAERLRAFRETARQIAHELKNPLTPIRFAVARLRRDASPELAETIEVLDIESRRLEEMARSFAQFGRLPEGPAADVDVAELARHAARTAVPPEVPLTLALEEGLPMVRGHHDALARALTNVLLNAVDACRAGGGIELRTMRARGAHGETQVAIAVHDSGCGIPPEKLAGIWDPYVTHKPGGTGLGLAIARQTIEAHRGSVSAASEPGHGTEIRFLLPVPRDAGAPAPADEAVFSNLARLG